MPRDIFGNYTLPAGNPVVTGTAIASSWGNTTLNDIATALTNSLSVDGSVTTNKIADGSVTTAKHADGSITFAKLAPSAKAFPSGENFLLNSAPQIWQDVTSLAMAQGTRYFADQWVLYSTGSSGSATQVAMPVGIEPNCPYLIQLASTSVAGAGNFVRADVVIEDVNTLSGRQVTASFYATCTTGTPSIALSLAQYFGAGGSTRVTTPLGKQALTLTPARYQFTFTIPTTIGKTVGSNSNLIALEFWLDAGTNFSADASSLGQQSISGINIWGVKLELGDVATPYVLPKAGAEIISCQRYFYRAASGGGGGFNPLLFSGNVTNTGSYFCSSAFPTSMRIIPTMSITATNNIGITVGTAAATTQGVAVPLTAAVTGGAVWAAFYTADARL